MLPAQVRKQTDDGHDALNGVVVLQSLSGQVSRRVARAVVGQRCSGVPTDLIGFSNAQAALTCPGLRRDANGRTLSFQGPFPRSLFVEHVLGSAQ